jgi:hypothetical protein
MKHNRRRRQLRPRPTRSQINQQIGRLSRALQLLQIESLLEIQQEKPSLPRLRFLDGAIGTMRAEISELEQF